MAKLKIKAYQELIDNDLDWLEKQPNTLERNHIYISLVWCRANRHHIDASLTPSRPDPLLSRQQVADFLGIRCQSIAAAESRGRPLLPKIQLSRTLVRYRQSDLDALIEARIK